MQSERQGLDPALDVLLVIPLHGSAGIFGPSCELCAQLAIEELNAEAGVLGRELRLSVVDGSGPPQRVADEVGAIVGAGLVDAVVGWHISAVRQAVAPRIAGRVPYVYTALYEGGEMEQKSADEPDVVTQKSGVPLPHRYAPTPPWTLGH